MTGELHHNEETTTVYQQLENFLQRFRSKIAPNHQLKSTGRFKMDVKYPEYREGEKVEVREKVALDVSSVVREPYDKEFMTKLKGFFTFLRKIFKSE